MFRPLTIQQFVRQKTLHIGSERKSKIQRHKIYSAPKQRSKSSISHHQAQQRSHSHQSMTPKNKISIPSFNHRTLTPRNSPPASSRTKIEKQVSPNKTYTDQTYFYKTLHNKRLWNWDHEQKYCQMQKTPESRPCKVSAGVLQRFRDYMQKKVGKRVPLVVKDIFEERSRKE